MPRHCSLFTYPAHCFDGLDPLCIPGTQPVFQGCFGPETRLVRFPSNHVRVASREQRSAISVAAGRLVARCGHLTPGASVHAQTINAWRETA